MKIHHIKTIEPFYTQGKNGTKNFELRYNDRGYEKGDVLHQMQFVDGLITGQSFYQIIKCVLGCYMGLEDGFVILGVENIVE